MWFELLCCVALPIPAGLNSAGVAQPNVRCCLARKVSVHLVEASNHIMGSFDEKLISYTTRLLENRKVSNPWMCQASALPK